MADYDSSLPIRSEADGADERVQTKIVDKSNPDTQQMEVDTDGNAHVEVHGNDPTGTDKVIRTSEQGSVEVDGVYDASNNTEPSNTGIIAQQRNATPGDTLQTERLTSVQDSGGTVRSLDVSLHDEDGEAYSSTNPLPVTLEESEGDEICDYNTTSSVIKDAIANHDYTVTALKTLISQRVWVAGSGKLKVELQLETGVASGIYNTFLVAFNSTANPNIDIPLDKICGKQIAGANVRIVITNKDNQPQDLYSTLMGIEK